MDITASKLCLLKKFRSCCASSEIVKHNFTASSPRMHVFSLIWANSSAHCDNIAVFSSSVGITKLTLKTDFY